MRIYLDVSCLNRPFDDSTQLRIALEAEAVTKIIETVERGEWEHVSSGIATIEIDAMLDLTKQARVRKLMPPRSGIMELTNAEFDRASELQKLGFRPADALHVAAAESLVVDVLLSCDDRLCRLGRRHANQLRIRVANPIEWLQEVSNANDE